MRTALLAVAVLASTAFVAADPPYAGKWKMNPAKSDVGQVTVEYAAAPGGGFSVTVDGLSYSFKADGQETPTPWGTTAAWRNVNQRTWTVTNRANGKVVSIDTLKLISDGTTLIIDSKVMKVDGGESKDRMTFRRISQGAGLVGKWKAGKLNSSAPFTLEITPKGDNGLMLRAVDQNSSCDAMLDGSDAAASGPMYPPGWTCAVSRNGDRGFDVTWKKDGKTMYKSMFSASSDGKTLTETTGAVTTTEKVRIVYDRQ